MKAVVTVLTSSALIVGECGLVYSFVGGNAKAERAGHAQMAGNSETHDGIGDFHAWTKVNPKPNFIRSPLDALCAGQTPAQMKKLKLDPHVHKFITVYVNPTGRTAMMNGGRFPVGSTVVKEKLLVPDGPVELSTVMIKREAGFNPKCGDWEFATLDAAGKHVTSRGKLESCMKCHEAQKKLDFTFRTYVPSASFIK